MINADEGDQRPVRSMEKPVSLAAVKLVVPLPDATTGTVRDVIVRDIVNGPVFHDRTTGRKHWTRFIAGLNTPIPWPKIEPKEHKEHDCDTLRLDVEAQSFVPSLLKPPMPGSVIDELRNKFSKFRTRHEESYLLKKIEEEREKEERKKSIKLMRTPINEINRRERKLRKAKGKGKLTAEMLARIGAVIAKKKEAALAAAGLSPATF
jgi:large subunit ribosomal protein L24